MIDKDCQKNTMGKSENIPKNGKGKIKIREKVMRDEEMTTCQTWTCMSGCVFGCGGANLEE